MLLERLGKELLFFDGGMGTLLQAEGLQPGELPETWNIERKETIRKIHQSYFEAGSDIVLTNTFGANALKFHDENCSLKAIMMRQLKMSDLEQRRGSEMGETIMLLWISDRLENC